MAIKNRNDLKSYFVKNAIPTEGNFADLIESQLNQAQDGVFKPEGEPLSVVAAPGDQKRVLRLYANYPAANPDWMISLNPAQDPATSGTSRAGLGVTDGAGNTRFFVDAENGRIGVGTNTPQFGLDVVGGARANGFRGQYDLVLNDYRTVNPGSNICLHSPPGDRDAWIYRDTADSGSNWGIYHRQINTPVASVPALPGNSIAFVGGGTSKLQAYVNLVDGSAWIAGPLTVNGPINAPAGLVFPGTVAHIEQDGALYRNTDGQVYLTVDDHFYIRDKGSASGVWAAHFTTAGVLELKGTLTAKTKNFHIDHPLDPERSLVHSAVEGPEAAVFYRGEAVLVNGKCEIELPPYFEALTRKEHRTVLVTPKLSESEESSALAASGVEDGRFVVRAIDRRNHQQRFYWEVKGVRADIDPIDVEPLKTINPRP